HRLPVKMRPSALTAWLGIQPREYPPAGIKDIDKDKFAVEWLKWWNGIQPGWRKATSKEPTLPLPLSTAKQGETLAGLKKAGPVGFMTVMVSLKWW
ncbi:hypothetical protein BDN70DRAFT_763684, partial [Pholiota conissans]